MLRAVGRYAAGHTHRRLDIVNGERQMEEIHRPANQISNVRPILVHVLCRTIEAQ